VLKKEGYVPLFALIFLFWGPKAGASGGLDVHVPRPLGLVVRVQIG